MSYKEFNAKVEEINKIIKEIESAEGGGGLALDEAYKELTKIHSAFISVIKETYADIYTDEAVTGLLPSSPSLTTYTGFKDTLKKLLKEKPYVSVRYPAYIEKCDKYIEIYRKMKAAKHIRSDIDYVEVFRKLYAPSPDTAPGNDNTDEQVIQESEGSTTGSIGEEVIMPTKQTDEANESEQPMNKNEGEQPMPQNGDDDNDDENRRKEEEKEKERKKKEEEERLDKLFNDKFLSLFIKDKKALTKNVNELKNALFENGFLFGNEVFKKVFSTNAADKGALEKKYAEVLIPNDVKKLAVYEYPAGEKQQYPEGVLSRNIFNGRTLRKDVLYIADSKPKEVSDWKSAHKDSIKEVGLVKYYAKKSVYKESVQEEIQVLRSSEDDLPLWYAASTGYSRADIVIATTSDKPPKCSDRFLPVEVKEVVDKIKAGTEPISYTGIDKLSCKLGNSCILFEDKDHMNEYSHPHDSNICPDILFCDKYGCTKTHLCKKGLKCSLIRDKSHCRNNIHIRTCDVSGCKETSLAHRLCGHPGTVKKEEITKLEELSMCSCDNLNTTRGWKEAAIPNFDLNIAMWMEKCKSYIGKTIETSNYEFKNIAAWFSGLLPIHLCPGLGLVGIARIGAITSLDMLINLWRSPDVKKKINVIFHYSYPLILPSFFSSSCSCHFIIDAFFFK